MNLIQLLKLKETEVVISKLSLVLHTSHFKTGVFLNEIYSCLWTLIDAPRFTDIQSLVKKLDFLAFPRQTLGVIPHPCPSQDSIPLMRAFKRDTIGPFKSRGCEIAHIQNFWVFTGFLCKLKLFSRLLTLVAGHFAPLYSTRVYSTSFESSH